jgi:hypothetical protein
MAHEHDREIEGALNRRQLLARGAIAGGLVWAAPIIRTTAAYATTSNGTELPCRFFYMVVINPAGQARPAPENINGASVPPAIRQWFRDNPGVDVQFPAVPPQLSEQGREAWSVMLPEVKGPNRAGRQCRMVLGWARKGNDFAEGYVDPNPPIAVTVGLRLIFPVPTRTAGPATDPSTGASAAGGGGSFGSDGTSSTGFRGDGQASTDQETGPGRAIDAIYLVYCCPR